MTAPIIAEGRKDGPIHKSDYLIVSNQAKPILEKSWNKKGWLMDESYFDITEDSIINSLNGRMDRVFISIKNEHNCRYVATHNYTCNCGNVHPQFEQA